MNLKTLTVTAKSDASQRTKNRIRENGPKFEFMEISHPICTNGRKAVLLESQSTDWKGWLLFDEISIFGVDNTEQYGTIEG